MEMFEEVVREQVALVQELNLLGYKTSIAQNYSAVAKGHPGWKLTVFHVLGLIAQL